MPLIGWFEKCFFWNFNRAGSENLANMKKIRSAQIFLVASKIQLAISQKRHQGGQTW